MLFPEWSGDMAVHVVFNVVGAAGTHGRTGCCLAFVCHRVWTENWVYIPTPCAESVQLQMVRPDSASKGLDEALRSLAYCGTARGMSLRGDTCVDAI
jgi:hypothetical protein